MCVKGLLINDETRVQTEFQRLNNVNSYGKYLQLIRFTPTSLLE